MNEPKNILIVRTDRIGDVVLTSPLAKIIKEHYLGCKVTFLLRNYTKPLLEKNPYVDRILTIEESLEPGFFQALKNIKKDNFDTALIVYPRFQLSLILWLACIKTRISTGYRWYSFLFNKKIYEHRKSAKKHELEYNLSLLEKLGIKNIDPKTVAFNIHPSQNSGQKIDNLLYKFDINKEKPTIIIHPGSGGSSIDLPISAFIELTRLLAQGLRYNILITGSESEKPICEKFVVHKNVKNLAGLFNLDELIALIGKSDMLIANSTGPIHIAAGMNKFVVGFYPKIKECSVQRWGPYTDKRLVFEPQIDCRDCTREKCSKLNCMSSIDINKVNHQINDLLKKVDKNENNS